eukprot:TRINITY_DN103636_c0_g1_i1.p1 TRINITY_DN103636_c0_g1~~TRINITY_DN103636_c0_g1_i1.p1  ORF type:complete len:181 (+),score=61.32 TRINITY_DN103636_c0_g1_i1:56-598(+)
MAQSTQAMPLEQHEQLEDAYDRALNDLSIAKRTIEGLRKALELMKKDRTERASGSSVLQLAAAETNAMAENVVSLTEQVELLLHQATEKDRIVEQLRGEVVEGKLKVQGLLDEVEELSKHAKMRGGELGDADAARAQGVVKLAAANPKWGAVPPEMSKSRALRLANLPYARAAGPVKRAA